MPYRMAMPENARTAIVDEATLRLSRAPAAEIAAGALMAQKAAGLERGADFILIAVPPGSAVDVVTGIAAAAALELAHVGDLAGT